ncbi:MAG: universal stress protein [Burkholderiales bacterium]
MLTMDEPPVEAIAAAVQETGADLVVIGHHRRSAIDRWWRGAADGCRQGLARLAPRAGVYYFAGAARGNSRCSSST